MKIVEKVEWPKYQRTIDTTFLNSKPKKKKRKTEKVDDDDDDVKGKCRMAEWLMKKDAASFRVHCHRYHHII